MKLICVGASGLIGRHLLPWLRARGHDVRPLRVRGTIAASDLEGVDGIINLAGEPIMGRWTTAKKARILESRAGTAAAIATAVQQLKNPPRVVVGASAVGYYGNAGDAVCDERHSAGTGFLPEVCLAWERALLGQQRDGVRYVALRIGMCLASDGGALPRLARLFRWGLGGRIGSGQQWMSWVAIEDLVAIIGWVLEHEAAGVYNAVAGAVTNEEFTRELARAVGRKAWFPLPAWLVRLAMGQMGEELLLASCRAEPRRLNGAGFEWGCKGLREALAGVLY